MIIFFWSELKWKDLNEKDPNVSKVSKSILIPLFDLLGNPRICDKFGIKLLTKIRVNLVLWQTPTLVEITHLIWSPMQAPAWINACVCLLVCVEWINTCVCLLVCVEWINTCVCLLVCVEWINTCVCLLVCFEWINTCVCLLVRVEWINTCVCLLVCTAC